MPALIDGAIVTRVLRPEALAIRGAFHPRPEDAVPGFPDNANVGTLVLLGWTGGHQFPAFATSPEADDGEPHPLDRWSRRLIDAAAAAVGAAAFYPFGGSPHHDFQRWALRAEPVARSPIGLLIHPRWGLWHAYRGALGFRKHLALTEVTESSTPCKACVDRPCLSSCPVAAFSEDEGYDVTACRQHIRGPKGESCMTYGCAARRACPVRAEEPYSPAQSTFHMKAFSRSGAGRERIAEGSA